MMQKYVLVTAMALVLSFPALQAYAEIGAAGRQHGKEMKQINQEFSQKHKAKTEGYRQDKPDKRQKYGQERKSDKQEYRQDRREKREEHKQKYKSENFTGGKNNKPQQ